MRSWPHALATLLLAACASARPSAVPLEPTVEEAGRIEALCGDDASCRRRLQLSAAGGRAHDAVPVEAVPKATGNWYCFLGGSPGHEVGACEQTFPDCHVTELASRELGLRITRPCAARAEAACFGVVQDETAVLFCAPTPRLCQRMEAQVTRDGSYEPFAPCELVGDDVPGG